MAVYKRGSHWHYRFRVRRVRYRGALPEARTKWEAEQAESKIKQDVFEGRYGKRDTGTMKLASFIDEIYMPWAKSNKTSWLNDHYNAVTLKNLQQFFLHGYNGHDEVAFIATMACRGEVN